MRKEILVIIGIMIVIAGAFAVAQVSEEEPEDLLSLDTYVVDAVIPENLLVQIRARQFVYDAYTDGEITYIVYYTDMDQEKLHKVWRALELLERQYNPLPLPYYLKNETNTFECDLVWASSINKYVPACDVVS